MITTAAMVKMTAMVKTAGLMTVAIYLKNMLTPLVSYIPDNAG
jgi:hypothetical protein